MNKTHEDQGTGYDPAATGHERQGRAAMDEGRGNRPAKIRIRPGLASLGRVTRNNRLAALGVAGYVAVPMPKAKGRGTKAGGLAARPDNEVRRWKGDVSAVFRRSGLSKSLKENDNSVNSLVSADGPRSTPPAAGR